MNWPYRKPCIEYGIPLLNGRTRLVVIQATPFCNIDCRYCYLPDRLGKQRISLPTVSKIAERLFESPFVRDEVTVVWHAGEPLVLPISFYEAAHEAIQQKNSAGVEIAWSMQTNATLITPEWCDFFKRHQVRVGVSLDGPRHIHDSSRVDRAKRGTFDRAMRGVQLMREAGLRPAVISVVTDAALDFPAEMWQFFTEVGAAHVGLNVEEVEGANHDSTMYQEGSERAYKAFLKGVLTAMGQDPSSPRLREYENVLRRITSEATDVRAQENVPMAILNFDCEGNVSTFSPELLSIRHERYGRFTLGNVLDHSLASLLLTDRFQELNSAVERGVERCRATCEHFTFCGGGWPSNKLGEADSFEITETASCRLRIKTGVEAVLEYLEERFTKRNPEIRYP